MAIIERCPRASRPLLPTELASTRTIPISFARAFIRSDRFDDFFRDGMAIIAVAADYLDRNRDYEEDAKKSGDPELGALYARYAFMLSQLLLCMLDWLNRRRDWQAKVLENHDAPPLSDDHGVLSERAPERFPELRSHPFLDGAETIDPLPEALPDELAIHIHQAGILHRRMKCLEAMFRHGRDRLDAQATKNQPLISPPSAQPAQPVQAAQAALKSRHKR